MNFPLNKPEHIDDGLDRQNIATIRKRFMRVNGDRLERLRGALSDRQQLFMDALPLLFHCNHPALPGFISKDTPARVWHYKPSKHDVIVGRSIARSFTLSVDANAPSDIHGIYIMGSVGSIAQSERSDLDIWICHRSELDDMQRVQLNQKCQSISRWAASLRLEAHFFLMDCAAFNTERFSALDEESSGSAQHLLLLDEFYRSAIFIVGRSPLWWHIPASAEAEFDEYADKLLEKRFLPKDSVINFGGVAEFPAGEFLGAGVWQLYKAIESPYKSVLKLLLLEAYAAEYPNTQPLSLTFKNKIYDGQLDIDELDGYMMIYRRIEDYLISSRQQHRLDFVRKCFYFKVNKALSRAPRHGHKSWQRQRLENLCKEWAWSQDYIEYLDGRAKWKAAQVNNEFHNLVDELNHCYRFLLKFAKNYGKERSISKNELLLLGRKLQAAFNHRPGKVDFVNPGISSDMHESRVTISQRALPQNQEYAPAQKVWTAVSLPSATAKLEQGTLIKASDSCIELVLWCYCNGVIGLSTNIDVDEGLAYSQSELRKLIASFAHWLPLPFADAEHRNFQHSSSPQSVMFLINAGSAASAAFEQDSYQRMSDKTDALRYGGAAENLVHTVDVVVKNNWNEISIYNFEGEDSLLEAMCEYLQMTLPGTHQRSPETFVSCIGEAYAATINQRVDKWIKDVRQCFFSGKHAKHKRFVFQLAERYCCLQFKGMKPSLVSLYSRKHLVEHLELEQPRYSPVVVDEMALPGHPLHLISKHSKPQAVDVFFRRNDRAYEIFLVDEYGSLHHSITRAHGAENPLKPLARFLRSVLARQLSLNPELPTDFGRLPLNFYELVNDSRGRLTCHGRAVSADPEYSNALDIKAIAHAGDGELVRYDFYCQGKEFSVQSYGEDVDVAVSKFILQRRSTQENYPVYISDLDLSEVAKLIAPKGQLQVVHYCRIKNRLESQLNQAIGNLSSNE